MNRSINSYRGLTLVECLLAMALVAILASLAAPSMRGLVASVRIQSQVQRLQSAVMLARTEARKREASVMLCPWDGQRCSGYYDDGFAVVTSAHVSDPKDSPELLRVFQGRPGLMVRNRSGNRSMSTPVRWDHRGMADRNLTFSVCSEGQPENVALVLNRLGRPRVVEDWGSCGISLPDPAS